MSLLCTHSHQMAMFSAKLQEEVWGTNPDSTASSSIAPFGRTEEVEGGVTFSWEMGWSSGCDHAEWAIMGFRRKNVEGTQAYCFAILPRLDYEIHDDWYAIGMRGSGSKTLIVKDAFVPEHRIQKAKDKRVLRLIRRYLEAGIMSGGITSRRQERTLQGGPLSPLLSNILLNELDREPERRGHRFVRYADDANIYVRSQRAGERVMASVERFLSQRLKLVLNRKKSRVERPWTCDYLGYGMSWHQQPKPIPQLLW